ncbi:MAG: hypothetical protein ACKO8U_20470 [Pirellula sp.]
MSKKTLIGKSFDVESSDPVPTLPTSEATKTGPSASIVLTNSIENRLQAWVKSVEKDTEEKVQEYLEQSDAGQNGE